MELERTDRVYLAPTEPRCAPQACSQQSTCARRLAALPPTGASITDVSLQWSPGNPFCAQWLSAHDARTSRPAPPPPRRHPPIGST